MYPAKNDIFEYNIQYQNDITFTEMRSVGYYILRMLTFNFDTFKGLWLRNSKIDFKDGSTVFTHAGLFYNAMQVSKAVETYTDNEFYELCLTFKNSISSSRKFSFLSNKFPDPVKCFIYFTKYFYIPVRIDVSSIDENMQKEYAKLWISCVSLLLFIHNYSIKFSAVIPTLETYYQSLEATSVRPEVVAALKTLGVDKIESYLTHKYEPTHKTSIFYTTMMKLIYNASIEIIRKFCPNYPAAKSINPNYDGTWLSPLDTDVNTQIRQIQSCIDSIY